MVEITLELAQELKLVPKVKMEECNMFYPIDFPDECEAKFRRMRKEIIDKYVTNKEMLLCDFPREEIEQANEKRIQKEEGDK